MEITSREMRKLLRGVWTTLRYIWIMDKRFWVPNKDQLKNLLEISKVDKERFRPQVWDCNNFALHLNSDVKYKAMEHYNKKLPIAFGEVVGSEFRGRFNMHAVNICFCEEGIYLIEPQDDRIWEAKSENDNVFFVKI